MSSLRKNGKTLRAGSLRDLRIADLDLFVSAAHLKSLGKAASLHHLSQSAASAAIQRVEASFGRSLCAHERRQFRLTEDGLQLLPKAESWLRSLRETVATQEALPMRIATTHAIARITVPAILSSGSIELQLMRPDRAYAAVQRDEADVALVLDNAPWEGVRAAEVCRGKFQLYCRDPKSQKKSLLLPEDQIEVLTLQQHWAQMYKQPLPIKARLPSWSLIADICSTSDEVGFLPDFLARQFDLHVVDWQPSPSHYRMLALYRNTGEEFQSRLEEMIKRLSLS